VVIETPDSRTIRYSQFGPDVSRTGSPGIRSLNVVSKALASNVATIITDESHGASVGDTVFLTGVDSFFTGKLDQAFNGRFVITNVPDPFSFTYSSGGILDILPVAVAGGLVSFGAKVVYGDFGSYTYNGNIGINFENLDKSGFYQDTQVYRGF